MDESVKVLIQKLRNIELQQIRLAKDAAAINTALQMLDLQPGKEMGFFSERKYAEQQPFVAMGLQSGCLQVLQDHPGAWLGKAQIEYLLARGGFESDAKDISNSIDVTLRRLAESGQCEIIRQRGVTGNKYRIPDKKGKGDDVKNQGATS